MNRLYRVALRNQHSAHLCHSRGVVTPPLSYVRHRREHFAVRAQLQMKSKFLEGV